MATSITNRTWSESRSVAELNLLLQKTEETSWACPENLDGLRRAIRLGAISDKQQKDFIAALALLWEMSKAPQWLKDLIKSEAAQGVCWVDCHAFVAASQQLSVKLLIPWFEITYEVKGGQFLFDAFGEMPVRHRSAVETVLSQEEGANERLSNLLVENLRHNRGTCDCYLWLLDSVRKIFNVAKKVKEPAVVADKILASNLPEVAILTDLAVLSRVLGRHVQGAALKSQNELRNLLNNDDLFRCLLIHNGEMEAVVNFVNFVKHASFLDQSERQGLLVKITRLCPDARYLVENKTVVKVRSYGKMSSMHSFQLKQKELVDLINVKIPANVRAIEIAREHGDLRENSEFKAAKEEQKILGSRRSGLERALEEVIPTDFSDVKVENTVVPGCKVTVRYEDDNVEDFYYILGIWDNDPEQKILSYDTPLGTLLVGKNVTEEIEMPNGKNVSIIAVEPLPKNILDMVRGEE